MTYGWDEKKNKDNQKKHGLNFADAEFVLGGQEDILTVEDKRENYGEQRFNCLGLLEGRLVHITYTERGDVTRIISMRKANQNEQKTYFNKVRSKKID